MLKRNLFAFICLCFALPCLAAEITVPFTKQPTLPYLISPQLSADASELSTFILNIKATQTGIARLMWANHYDPQFNQQKSIMFRVKKGDHNYYINLGNQNPNWIGWIKGLLVYPEADQVEVKNARLVPGNVFTNIISGWQEFWGPKGRDIIGSTINTIQPVNLFGQSIFVYIYWLIGLAGLFFFALKRDFNQTGKFVFLLIGLFWFFLEASSLYNNWLAVKSDWKYVGQSYRDKLVLANTGDFYPFIEFCAANLPLSAKFDLRIPPIYNDIKARYYLIPRQETSTEAEFIVVYDPGADQKIPGKFKLFKTFRKNAYLMKKGSNDNH